MAAKIPHRCFSAGWPSTNRIPGWHRATGRAPPVAIVLLTLVAALASGVLPSAAYSGPTTEADSEKARLAPPPRFPVFDLSVPSVSAQEPPASASTFAMFPVEASAALSVDTHNRAAVVAFWNEAYLVSQGVPAEWTGDVATCTAGDTAQNHKEATLQRLNFYRAMVGLPGTVTMHATLNAKCRDAALMMIANVDLDHDPPYTWACWTLGGAEAARNSNLALGIHGPDAVDLSIQDPGEENEAVGHRRWCFFPRLTVVGLGATDAYRRPYRGSDAMWMDSYSFGARPATPEWVAWPGAGYFPHTLVPQRWSFSYPGADFSQATVVMRRNRHPVAVTLEPVTVGYGDNTLVWVPDIFVPCPAGPDAPHEVEIANVGIGGVPRSFAYSVIVIDPTVPAPPPPPPVDFTGWLSR